jgi:putative FmdB family regulatory protein
MPTYEFHCPTCGPFEFRRSMQETTSIARCPTCEASSTRVYTVPATPQVSPGLRRMLEAQDASRHEPHVVHSVPSGGGPSRRKPHPLHSHLPRH